MQETPLSQIGVTNAVETGLDEYLNAALMQTEYLQQILRRLQNGNELSLAAWKEAFDGSHRTIDHLNKAVTLAQEIFDGHVILTSGALSEDLVCDEFQCLTWK
jgi:hypothetical protein